MFPRPSKSPGVPPSLYHYSRFAAGNQSIPSNSSTSSTSHQLPERPQIDHVQILPFLLPLRRLQVHGYAPESGVVEQESERFQAHATAADVLMAVDSAAKLSLRVVQVKRLHLADADGAVEFPHGCSVVQFCPHRVSGGEGMAGIEADSQPVRIANLVQDPRQVFEPVADIGPLTGGDFEQYSNVCLESLAVGFIQCQGYPPDPIVEGTVEVGAGVGDKVSEAQRVTASNLLDHRV